MEISGQNIVVIGGTSGIGLATAIAASQAGANVWSASRSADKVSLCQSNHPNINFSQVDIHDPAGLKLLFEKVGKINHIVGAATGANRTMVPFM